MGKSALLFALQHLVVLTSSGFPEDFWPDSKPTQDLSLGIRIRLNAEELGALANIIRIHSGKSEMSGSFFSEKYGSDIEALTTWAGPGVGPSRSLLFTQKDGRHTADIDPSYSDYRDTDSPVRLGGNVYGELVRLLGEAFFLFPEFRLRPQATSSEVLRSTEGTNAASVLFHLKNGDKVQQDRFRRIQTYFTKLFPTLKFEMYKPRGAAPRVVIEKVRTGHELPIENVGAGIAEMLIILTHVVAEQNKVFALDGPELHLHPHSQRLLSRFLRESSIQNQLVLATH